MDYIWPCWWYVASVVIATCRNLECSLNCIMTLFVLGDLVNATRSLLHLLDQTSYVHYFKDYVFGLPQMNSLLYLIKLLLHMQQQLLSRIQGHLVNCLKSPYQPCSSAEFSLFILSLRFCCNSIIYVMFNAQPFEKHASDVCAS